MSMLSPDRFLFFNSGSQPIEWCHPHSGWVFPLLVNPDSPSHTCQETSRVSRVNLEPMLTIPAREDVLNLLVSLVHHLPGQPPASGSMKA